MNPAGGSVMRHIPSRWMPISDEQSRTATYIGLREPIDTYAEQLIRAIGSQTNQPQDTRQLACLESPTSARCHSCCCLRLSAIFGQCQ
jgi:hypothetical protein